MIVIGIDPHKKTHTAVAVTAHDGRVLDSVTVAARAAGYAELLCFAERLGRRRSFALEDVRQVSGGLERFLLGRGERVVRVPPKLMAGQRSSARAYGKSDPFDAEGIARAALREPALPQATLAGPALEIKLLLSHREDLVGEKTRLQNRLRWHLHDLDPALAEVPPGAFGRPKWLDPLARRLARLGQSVRVRVARDLVRRCRELARAAHALESELGVLVRTHAAPLLALPGCGVLTAAKLVAEVAGVERFESATKLAMFAGVAPLDASSGRQGRHRLNPFGNRQLNCALQRIAIAQGRLHPPARAFLARKQAAGKTRREAFASTQAPPGAHRRS